MRTQARVLLTGRDRHPGDRSAPPIAYRGGPRSGNHATARPWRIVLIVALTVVLAACAAPQRRATDTAAPRAQVPAPIAKRILALDPGHVTAADVALLAEGPTPRLMLLHGGIYPVYLIMRSFGEFLVGMGYPEDRIRRPGDGAWSYSPYEDAERLAGIVAWYYEKDGLAPLLVGHSQGGMQVVKVLHVLAGEYAGAVPVWDPMTDFPERRTAIVDPLTGRTQPVVGMRIGYASALSAGGAAFFLPNQWSLIGKLREIPDTVEEFTGYWVDFDFIAWTFPGTEKERDFYGSDKVRVRNVTLSMANNHIFVPLGADVPGDLAARKWIDAYVPGTTVAPPETAAPNLPWLADVWYTIKKFWVIEAQRYLRAAPVRSAAAVGTLE